VPELTIAEAAADEHSGGYVRGIAGVVLTLPPVETTTWLHVYAPVVSPRAPAHAAVFELRSESEYAAKPPVDFIHDGCRRVADRFLKVGLNEGDQGGDVDD
jgi:hypothetical protein